MSCISRKCHFQTTFLCIWINILEIYMPAWKESRENQQKSYVNRKQFLCRNNSYFIVNTEYLAPRQPEIFLRDLNTNEVIFKECSTPQLCFIWIMLTSQNLKNMHSSMASNAIRVSQLSWSTFCLWLPQKQWSLNTVFN